MAIICIKRHFNGGEYAVEVGDVAAKGVKADGVFYAESPDQVFVTNPEKQLNAKDTAKLIATLEDTDALEAYLEDERTTVSDAAVKRLEELGFEVENEEAESEE